MNQTVFVKTYLPVALIAVLQALVPPIVVTASLYLSAGVFQVDFDEYFVALAVLAAVLSMVMLNPGARGSPLPHRSTLNLGSRILLGWLALIGVLLALGYATQFSEHFSRRAIVLWAFVTPPALVACACALHALLRRVLTSAGNARSAVIVGYNSSSRNLAEKLAAHPELCISLEGFFDDRGVERLGSTAPFRLLGRLSTLPDYVRTHGVEVIFVALPMRHVQRVMDLIDELQDSTASLYYVPDLFVFDLIQSRTAEIMGVPVVSMCETPFYGYRGVLKRISDIAFTLAILVPTLPVMAVIALTIKLTSRGPVIFRQRRYGLDGKEITVYKFRSMRVIEDGEEIAQATRDDPRITPVGRILRKFSLDELPQLFNVLQGRMSLVGPRPHAVAHNEEYRRRIKGYMIRHKVLPGITGLAQVNGCRGETRNLEQMEDRVAWDLDYLRKWTPWLDFKILVLTVLRVFNDRHAY